MNQWKPVKKLPDDYKETRYTYDPLINWIALAKFAIFAAVFIWLILAVRWLF